ncbi:MAG: hypothetical protein AAFY12_11965 [Pseudomonadota bacterium]
MAKQASTQDDSIIQIPREDYEIMRAHLFAMEAYAKSVAKRFPQFTPAHLTHCLAEQATFMVEGCVLNTTLMSGIDVSAPLVPA